MCTQIDGVEELCTTPAPKRNIPQVGSSIIMNAEGVRTRVRTGVRTDCSLLRGITPLHCYTLAILLQTNSMVLHSVGILALSLKATEEGG